MLHKTTAGKKTSDKGAVVVLKVVTTEKKNGKIRTFLWKNGKNESIFMEKYIDQDGFDKILPLFAQTTHKRAKILGITFLRE